MKMYEKPFIDSWKQKDFDMLDGGGSDFCLVMNFNAPCESYDIQDVRVVFTELYKEVSLRLIQKMEAENAGI